jgi:hypothetical protein
MSKRDLIRFEVIEAFRSGKISRSDASKKLEVSERQVSRLALKCRSGGLEGLLHRNRGKAPKSKTDPIVAAQYLELYKKKYFDFNFSHALEWIHQYDGIPESQRICYETFRHLCRNAGVGKIKMRKPSKSRVQRERAASQGAILQMDGSPHEWHGSEKSTLVALIDDATSILAAAALSDSETTWACFNVLKQVIIHQGVPGIIITDQAGWAGGAPKRSNFSQFGRLCEELGIILIRTSTAQAKGRIERFFRTAQDRLIPELRIKGIKNRIDSNRYIQQVFIPSWNEQFAVQPMSDVSRYKSFPAHLKLDELFCMKHFRKAARDQSINFEGKVYKILNREWGSLWKRQITIHEAEDNSLKLYLGTQILDHEEVRRPLRGWYKKRA